MAASKRKPNWSSEELDTIAQAVSENLHIIRGKFSPAVTNVQKMKCWDTITDRINAVNVTGTRRETSEVKKKWLDLSSLTKKKEASRLRQQRMTGGGSGPSDDLKSWEKVIIGCLAKSSVEGVSGGVDTLENIAATENINMYAGGDHAGKLSGSTSGSDQKSLPSTGAGNNVVIMTSASCNSQSAMTEKGGEEVISKKKRKITESSSSNIIRNQFLKMEEEKENKVSSYRERKLELYKKMIDQQDELINLQRRSVAALELLAVKAQGQSNLSPFSLSPMINFNQ